MPSGIGHLRRQTSSEGEEPVSWSKMSLQWVCMYTSRGDCSAEMVVVYRRRPKSSSFFFRPTLSVKCGTAYVPLKDGKVTEKQGCFAGTSRNRVL